MKNYDWRYCKNQISRRQICFNIKWIEKKNDEINSIENAKKKTFNFNKKWNNEINNTKRSYSIDKFNYKFWKIRKFNYKNVLNWIRTLNRNSHYDFVNWNRMIQKLIISTIEQTVSEENIRSKRKKKNLDRNRKKTKNKKFCIISMSNSQQILHDFRWR